MQNKIFIKNIQKSFSLKTAYALVFSLLSLTGVNGQNWHPLNSGTTEKLNCIQFRLSYQNTMAGWAVGYNNTGLVTQDGGDNWASSISSNVDNFCVYFTIVDFGHVAGSFYRLWYTDAGGLWWYPHQPTFSQNYYGVWFDYRYNGWAVGDNGVIIQSTNEGWTWLGNISGTTNTLRAVQGIDSTTVWSVGDSGTILKTSNSGSNWIAQTSNTTNDLKSLSFTSRDKGWICGRNGTILHTDNGGALWTPQTSGILNNLNGIYFTDSLHGWAVGDAGIIISTTNGGLNWHSENSGTTVNLNSVNFYNKNNGWACGDSGVILRRDSAEVNTVVFNSSAASPDVIVYPTLATDVINLKFTYQAPSHFTFTLFDHTGKKVMEGNDTEKIKISSLAKGAYILEIINEDRIVRKKFFKQ